MTLQPLNVVYASDDGFAMQLGISMLSLMKNNQDIPSIELFILDGGISPQNCEKLSQIARNFHRKISFIPITEQFFKRLNSPAQDHKPVSTHGFHIMTYARIFLVDLLPKNVDQVLYLDCDTIVSGSLKVFTQIDLGKDKNGFLLAAVPELYMPPKTKMRSIHFQKNETYYNAGVLLFNLKLWRKVNRLEYCLQYYRKHQQRLLYNDQDLLNACCRQRIAALPMSFNMNGNTPYFPQWFRKIIQPAYEQNNKIAREMIRHPVIIHYLGDERPWIHGSRNYYRAFYERYKRQSPWADASPVYGKERYMFLYHVMNVLTRCFPWGRLVISNLIGINLYQWFGKH